MKNNSSLLYWVVIAALLIGCIFLFTTKSNDNDNRIKTENTNYGK